MENLKKNTNRETENPKLKTEKLQIVELRNPKIGLHQGRGKFCRNTFRAIFLIFRTLVGAIDNFGPSLLKNFKFRGVSLTPPKIRFSSATGAPPRPQRKPQEETKI